MKEISPNHQALSLKPGIYRHYKGKKYRLIGIALHSGKKLLWVRPLKMFLETVTIGKETQSRFQLTSS